MEILPFKFDNSEVRIFTDSKNNIWFVAKDILAILEISTKHTSMTLKKLDEDEQTTIKMLSGGQYRDMKAVSESGFYKLVLRSNKLIAKPFQKWITREVLPQIRKTGSYSISQTPNLSKLEIRAKQIHIASNLTTDFYNSFKNIGITKPEELGITVNRAVKNETSIDFIQLSGKAGIETLEKFFTVTELCKHIRNSSDFSESQKLSVSTKKNDKPRAENLNNILRDKGFQERIDGDWKTSEKGEKFSQFVQNKSKHSQKTIYHTVWNLEILKEIF